MSENKIEATGKGRANPPATRDLKLLRTAAKRCRACHLYRCGTQTVFGEGPKAAPLFVVGEQPGDHEDLSGRPFVGPAGRLFDQLLTEAGVDRARVYVTNAVKHFKWKRAGKKRLHQKPDAGEIKACHPWLESELAAVKPGVILCLGATAARSVLGKTVGVGSSRGRGVEALGRVVFVTWHPSSVLRSPDAETRARLRRELRTDIKRAWRRADRASSPR